MAGKKPAAKAQDGDLKFFKLSDVKVPTTYLLWDYYLHDEGSEWGPSYLLKLEKDGVDYGVWIGERTSAYKAFNKAIQAGHLEAVDEGGKVKLIFRPKDTGKDNMLVELRFGGRQSAAQASSETPF